MEDICSVERYIAVLQCTVYICYVSRVEMLFLNYSLYFVITSQRDTAICETMLYPFNCLRILQYISSETAMHVL